MRALLCCFVAGVGMLGTATLASASTITLLGADGISANQVNGTLINGSVSGGSALVYGSDYVEFDVVPTTNTTVTVDVLAASDGSPSYPDELWKIVGGPVNYGPFAVTNTPVTLLLRTGFDYFLELASGTPGAPDFDGDSQLHIKVLAATPLPGAIALFTGGLGLLGFAGMRRNRKVRRDLALGAA
jgi:hypothetical protein